MWTEERLKRSRAGPSGSRRARGPCNFRPGRDKARAPHTTFAFGKIRRKRKQYLYVLTRRTERKDKELIYHNITIHYYTLCDFMPKLIIAIRFYLRHKDRSTARILV